MIELGPNRYGKSAIRLVKVIRGPDGHRVRDLTVAVALEGDFGVAHTDGDNATLVATDTMKNTVYALAPEHLIGADRGVRARARGTLPRRDRRQPIDDHDPRASLGADPDRRWPGSRCVPAPRRLHPDRRRQRGARRSRHGRGRDRGPHRHEDGAGPPSPASHATSSRRCPTRTTGSWRRRSARSGATAGRTSTGMPSTMASSARSWTSWRSIESPSVQASIFIVGRAILERHVALDEVRMVLPNLHHWAYDLTPVRPREPIRDLRGDDRAARADRGDRPPVGPADGRHLPAGVEIVGPTRPGR